MNADLRNRISPPVQQGAHQFSDATAKSQQAGATDEDGSKSKIDFKSMLIQSNSDAAQVRKAKEAGDLSGASSYEEFLEQLNQQTTKQRTPKNSLGKDDFLKLFVTQLQNQDPLKPKDGTEMASQLAQFNSVEQMMNVNKGLERLESAQSAAQSTNFVNFIGKDISVEGGRFRLTDKGVGDVEYEVPKNLTSAKLEIRDSAGALVASRDLGSLTKGKHKMAWDGLGEDGQKLSNATFTASVSGKDIEGKDHDGVLTTRVSITGIDMSGDQREFFTPMGKMKLSDIASVGEVGFRDVAIEAKQEKQEKQEKPAEGPIAAPASRAPLKSQASVPPAPVAPGAIPSAISSPSAMPAASNIPADIPGVSKPNLDTGSGSSSSSKVTS